MSTSLAQIAVEATGTFTALLRPSVKKVLKSLAVLESADRSPVGGMFSAKTQDVVAQKEPGSLPVVLRDFERVLPSALAPLIDIRLAVLRNGAHLLQVFSVKEPVTRRHTRSCNQEHRYAKASSLYWASKVLRQNVGCSHPEGPRKLCVGRWCGQRKVQLLLSHPHEFVRMQLRNLSRQRLQVELIVIGGKEN